jgi:tetratricopeptide (TPR) repeat protein
LSQWDEALNLIQRAVASDSQNGWIRLEFGKTLMKLGRLEEARGQISQAGSFLPHSIWPYVWLSKLNYLSGECELNNRIKNIIGVWSKWEWSYLVNAWNNLCEGNDEVALSQLSECLSRHPEFREAIELKSRILLDKGMFDELGRHLRPLLDQNVNEPLAYSFLAESFFWQKNMLMADDMGQSKIKVSDRNPWPHVWQGFLLLEKNQNKQAQESFELAEKYGGQDSTLQGFLTLGELGNNQIDKAWIRVTRVLSQYPRDAFLWFARGEVESKMDRMVEAERSYSTSIQLKPYFLQPALALLKLSPSELTLSNALKINAKHSEVLEWRRKIRPRN